MKPIFFTILLIASAIFAKENGKDSVAFTPKLFLNSSDYQTIADSMVPGSKFGISIRSLHSGNELISVQSDSFFTPASTLKTVTTAAALDFLPLQFRAKTSVQLAGSISGKTFRGVIRLRGEGDPGISGRFYAEPFYILHSLADSIRAKGIDTLQIRTELDTSYFSGPRKPEHWRSNYFLSWYGAEVTPLIFNDNCALIHIDPGENENDSAKITVEPDIGYVQINNTLKTVNGNRRKWRYALDPDKPIFTISGSIGKNVKNAAVVIPVRNPNRYFEAAFLHALKDRNITVAIDSTIPSGIELVSFSFEGTPLLSFLDEINQRSQNLHAEALFRNFSAVKYQTGNVENGRKGVKEFLQKLHLNPDDFVLFDGCGLSPDNKLKPSAETQLLAAMARHPKGKFYIQSFAGPGIGSGAKRMQNLDYAWCIRFKTGFINETHGLVGFMPTIDGDTLLIASYFNKTGKIPDNVTKDALDSIWSCIYRAANNGYNSLLTMKDLYHQGSSITGLENRIRFFSEKFLDIPYGHGGPTGEGFRDSISPMPMINTDSLDCVTFIEHVLALAKSPSDDSIFSVLQKLRYIDGKISYRFRKHYFVVDWIGEGKFARQIALPNDTLVERIISKKEFFKTKNIQVSEPDTKLYLRYLPLEKAIEFAGSPWQGKRTVRGIGFVSKLNSLDIVHTGFLILDRGKLPILRDASYKFNKVVDHELVEYLNSWVGTGKIPGIILFEFL